LLAKLGFGDMEKAENSIQLGLAQLAALVFASATLIAAPNLAIGVAVFIGITLSFSIASTLALGQASNEVEDDEVPPLQFKLLGIHFGGMLCYLVLMIEAFRFI
jgi:hypothetical protein